MTEPEPDEVTESIFDKKMGPFSNEPELDALAIRMFRQFARFEYALKSGGKLLSRDGDAKPDWDGFAREIHEAVEKRREDNGRLRQAIDYLMTAPPKKQVARAGRLDWEAVVATKGTDTEKLLVYVRRVRNNLFHGGKYSENWPDVVRDARLIRASLMMLHGCLELSNEVRGAYEI